MDLLAAEAEAQLVERAKTETDAFRQLYEQYLPRVYRYACYRTGDAALAEDVVAQTFLRVWQHLKRFEQRGIPFSHWLYRIAGNVTTNMCQGKTKTVSLTWEPDDNYTATEQVDLRLDLVRYLRELPDAQQQVLTLRYVQDLSLQEVAGIMQRSEGAIKQLAFRGLKTLRERMGRDADELER